MNKYIRFSILFCIFTFCSKDISKPFLSSRDFISIFEQSPTYIITATTLNIRENPDITSKIVSTINQNSKIKIDSNTCSQFSTDGKKGTWLKIEDGTSSGYIFSGFIKPSKEFKLNTIINYNSKSSGEISGNLSYPGEGIPACMLVCAIDIKMSSQYCSESPFIHYKFKINVPEGNYYVYTAIPFQSIYGLYSEYSLCGNKIECKTDKMIPVKIVGQAKVGNINPSDYYSYSKKSWF